MGLSSICEAVGINFLYVRKGLLNPNQTRLSCSDITNYSPSSRGQTVRSKLN